MRVLLIITITFLFLVSNTANAINSEVSIPSTFVLDVPQTLVLDIRELSKYAEYSLTVFIESGSNHSGFLLKNNKWIKNDKFPVSITTTNNTEWRDAISFKINSTSILPGNYNLSILLKTENSTFIEISSKNIVVLRDIGFVDMAFDLIKDEQIEISSSDLLHRYNPEQFIMYDSYDNAFFRFPVRPGTNNLSFLENEIEFDVSYNETINIGNIYDIEIQFKINNSITPWIIHDNIFKIINNGHATGERENITVFVTYNVTNFNTMKTTFYNFSKSGINSYTGTRTGFLELVEGEYKICARIQKITKNGSTVIDKYVDNNFICDNITVKLTKENSACESTFVYLNNETYFGKKYKFKIIFENFKDEKYLLKINSNDIISNKENSWHILVENNETEVEINFDSYSIYKIDLSVADATCNYKNTTFVNTTFFVSAIEEDDFGIESEIQNKTYFTGDNIKFPLFIYNGFDDEKRLNLSTKIKRKTQKGWVDAEELSEKNMILQGISSTVLRDEIFVENDTISGYYKIYVKVSDGEKTRYSEAYFSISGLPDMGEENITILKAPTELKFGDMNSVLIDFYSGNSDNLKGTFVAYINKNLDTGKTRYPSIDFDFSTLYSKIYYSISTVDIDIKRGEHYFISLPIFITPNCDDKYENGLYRGSARAYLSENRKVYESADFEIDLEDGDDMFCETECVSCKTTQSPSIYIESEKETKPEFIFPSSIPAGEEFEVSFDAENTENGTVNMTVYSYVFDGNKLLSEGFDGNSWGRSWNSNKKEIAIDANGLVTVNLKNKIKEEVQPGRYSIRVRKMIGDKKEDKTEYINVVVDDNPKEEEHELEITWKSDVTGYVVQASSDCVDCKIMMSCPEGLLEFDEDIYYMTTSPGIYNFFLVRNSVIIDAKTANITNSTTGALNETEFDTNLKTNSEYNGISVTGAMTQKEIDMSWIFAIINYLRFFI